MDQQVALDDNGKPVTSSVALDDNGNPINQQQPQKQQNNESLFDKIFFHPLLPNIDSNDTRSSIGANIPIIKDIWPGGIELPNLHTLYRDILQPASTGLGLLGTALGIASEVPMSRGGAPNETAPLQPEVLPKETPIPVLSHDTDLLHGTTRNNYVSIMQSGRFDPNAGITIHPEYGPVNLNRPYDYSVAGPDSIYFTKEKNTWLNSDWADNSRAVSYDTSLKGRLAPDARIAQVNSIEDLNNLAKKAGFNDIHDFANQISVDGLRDGSNPEEIARARRAIQQFMNKTGYHGIDINYDDPNLYANENISYEQAKAQENPFGGRQVIVFDSSKVKPILPPKLPEHRVAGYLPESAQSVPPRFYAGPAGIADARLAYPYDIQDPAQPNPQSISSGEPGVQQPNDIGPILAANRSIIETKDPAQLNPAFRALVPNRYSPQSVPLGLQGLPKDVPESTLQFRPGGEIINPPEKPIPFGSNQVDVINRRLASEPEHGPLAHGEVWQAHTPDEISAKIDKLPGITNGDVVKPPPDIINSTPVDPVIPSDITIPRAGQARPNVDPSKWSELNNAHKVMAMNDDTAPIGQLLTDATDRAQSILANFLQNNKKFVSGLNKSQREILGQLMSIGPDKIVPSELASRSGITPDLIQRANGLRAMVTQAYDSLPSKGGLGKLENYFPQIPKDPTNPIFKYYFGSTMEDTGPKPGTSQFQQTGAVPLSRYLRTRPDISGPFEYDVNKVLPAYMASMVREAIIRPAVEQARVLYERIPDGTTRKDFANAFINNISGYDGEGKLHQEWNKTATRTSNMIGRAFADWNLPLHLLHLGEIPANIWPELGTEYTAKGFYRLVTGGHKSWDELARTGLVQGETVPWAFKTASERYQSLAQGLNLAESLVKGIGYFGAKQMLADKYPNLSPAQLQLRAIQVAKDATLTTDIARMPKALTPESNLIGGTMGSKLSGKFKGVPLTLVNQYKDIIANTFSNPKKTARMVAGGGLVTYLLGSHAKNLVTNSTTFGAMGQTISNVFKDLSKQDLAKAVSDTAEWLFPGMVGASNTIRFLNEL